MDVQSYYTDCMSWGHPSASVQAFPSDRTVLPAEWTFSPSADVCAVSSTRDATVGNGVTLFSLLLLGGGVPGAELLSHLL